MDPNPYETPRIVAEPSPSAARGLRQVSLGWLIWPSLAGLFVGLIVFAPFLRWPGDPHGFAMGMALGVMPGLAIGMTLRLCGFGEPKVS